MDCFFRAISSDGITLHASLTVLVGEHLEDDIATTLSIPQGMNTLTRAPVAKLAIALRAKTCTYVVITSVASLHTPSHTCWIQNFDHSFPCMIY
jgi:hypothetical protein